MKRKKIRNSRNKKITNNLNEVSNEIHQLKRQIQEISTRLNINFYHKSQIGLLHKPTDYIANIFNKYSNKLLYIIFLIYFLWMIIKVITDKFNALRIINIIGIILISIISYNKIKLNKPQIIDKLIKKIKPIYLVLIDFYKTISLIFVCVLTLEQLINYIGNLICNILNFYALSISNRSHYFNFEANASLMVNIFLIIYVFLFYPIKMILISFLQLNNIKWLRYQPSLTFVFSNIGLFILIVCKILLESTKEMTGYTKIELDMFKEYYMGIYWLIVLIYTLLIGCELLWAGYRIDKADIDKFGE